MTASLTFADPVDWNQSRTYEVNMIVFVGRKAYTALQNVPANIQITNTAYWKETGVPGAGDISNLESDVSTLKTAVGNQNSGLVKDVADNTSDISSLETTVGNSSSGLVKSVADNTSDISSLESTIGNASAGLVKDVADNANNIDSLESDMDNVKFTLYTPTN